MGLSNNDIMKKLRVAHKLRTEDMVEIIGLAGLHVNKGQLNDLFRADDHPSFVPCGDQIVRNFLDGLIIKLRGPRPPKKKEGDTNTPAKPRKVITLDKKDKPKKRIKKSERN